MHEVTHPMQILVEKLLKGGMLRCRQSADYLCSLSRLSFMLELKGEGSLEGFSAILGCPLHMPQAHALQAGALLGSSSQQQSLVFRSLLAAVNWVRELLNAWAHHAQATGYALLSPQQMLSVVETVQGLTRSCVHHS